MFVAPNFERARRADDHLTDERAPMRRQTTVAGGVHPRITVRPYPYKFQYP